MLGLTKVKDAPEKIPAATALTPAQWREHLKTQNGEYVVVGGKPGDTSSSAPYSRETAQWIFDELVADCDFATDGYRLKIVAVGSDS